MRRAGEVAEGVEQDERVALQGIHKLEEDFCRILAIAGREE